MVIVSSLVLEETERAFLFSWHYDFPLGPCECPGAPGTRQSDSLML